MQIAQSEFHDALVRGLSHRMNNILSLFHGYLGLLFDNENLDPGVRAGLACIREGAEEAAELMERAKSLARPATVVWREISVPELLARQRPSFEEWLKPGTSLSIECPEGLPLLWSDASRFRTVLMELVRNAAEAAPEPGGQIRISVKMVETPCAGLEGSTEGLRPLGGMDIVVADNGGGIPAENQDRVFHPFHTTKQRRNAAGLGLTVALGLANQLGGALRFDSKRGETNFHLFLPALGERGL